jgi:phosphate transport system protein
VEVAVRTQYTVARENYQEQLRELREDVVEVGDVVLEQLRAGLAALESKDSDLAEEVIEGDDEINRLYLDLESDCIDLLALQQPVAGDLRFVASSFKIITDLERIGDLATNLARYAIEAERERYPEVDVQRIGSLAVEMVEDAMAAYAAADVEASRAIADRDEELDAMCEAASETIARELIAIDADPHDSADAVVADVKRLLLTVRDLERVGDHAVNVAARTLYMVENSDELIY